MKKKITLILSALLIMCVGFSLFSCGGGADTVSVSYELSGGTLPSDAPDSYTPGEAPDFTKVIPTRAGYEFLGWYVDAAFTTSFSESAVTGNSVKLYAKWDVEGCAITYVLDGGTLPSDAPTKHITGERTSLSLPEKSGYIFDGWFSDADFEVPSPYIAKDVDEDVTLYAKWLLAPSKVSEIPDQSRGYFGQGYDTITLDVSKYVNANGSELTYSATSSNTDFATVTVNGSILSIKISGSTGSSDITLDVSVGEEKYLMYEFSVTPKNYTKIACVGDSLTASSPCYPTYLQAIVGSGVEVGNFGRSGASLSQYTNNDSYGAYNSVWNQTIYADGVEFVKDADLVIIMLGTNDATKIENGQPKFAWDTVKPAYKAAYQALINDYKAVNPDIEIVMMTSPPVLSENTLSISNEILDTKTYALQLEIAEELGIKLLDFRAYVKSLSGGYDDYYRDGVHFNEAGAQLFADFVAKGI